VNFGIKCGNVYYFTTHLHTQTRKPSFLVDSSEQSFFPINDPDVVERMFRQYYNMVCNTINFYLRDRNSTEDVAQEMFAELWAKRNQLIIHTSVPAYLRRMAVTRALNYIRDSRKHNWDELETTDPGNYQSATEPDVLQHMEESELARRIDQAILRLPEKCRIVFLMSRVEEMSYAEIASSLNISVKTVENQIGKALKSLRLSIGSIGGKSE
jgi:RNA polymerase sigma-70 factor (ECF subfamily)